MFIQNFIRMYGLWTENAEMKGGTAQSLRIAQEFNIKVYNIADPKQQNGLDNYIESVTVWEQLL
jgi:hypothetical protein